MPSSQQVNPNSQIEKSLKYSIGDGFFYAIMVGVATSFFVPFAVFLRANNVQLGLLGTLPQVVGFLVQLFSHKILSYFHSRKQFVCTGAFIQGCMLIPIALTFFLGDFKVYYLLLFISLYWALGMVFGPVWNSWMGDLAAENERGSYFGKRNNRTRNNARTCTFASRNRPSIRYRQADKTAKGSFIKNIKTAICLFKDQGSNFVDK